MSDSTPTLQQLLKALKMLENWFVFGVVLGVPVPQLKKIESSYSQKELERCKIDMLQYWLDNNVLPLWNEIVQALEQTDQLALASQIKHDYLWSTEKESSTPSPATLSAPVTNDEIKAKIKADVTVVSNLKKLEASFSHMLVQVKRLLVLNKCDLSDALLFLDSFVGSEDFIGCDNFDKLVRQLQRDHIDVFNISVLQQLVNCFDDLVQTDVIEAYIEKKESFLKQTTVLEFQRAVVSRVEPILASGMAVVTITISKEMASHRTLKDIEKLAMEGFEECHKKFIRLHAEPGSIIISWVFPKELSGRLEQMTLDNVAVFKNNGVMEVTVEGKRLFPCTQQEEEKSKLKQVYTEFYQQLIEAVSDPDTCHSLTTQLHSTSLLSEEKKAVLSSSMATGQSFLKVLGVEEEPHLVTVLMEKMSVVKELQTLSEDMRDWLSGSKQGATDDTRITVKQAYYERIERKQLLVDIEKLTCDKADLTFRLQCCEEDLKTTNELLRMREKAISGMMAAIYRRDTDVEERDERISHLKKELEEMKRERVKSMHIMQLSTEMDTTRQLKDRDHDELQEQKQLKDSEDTIANVRIKLETEPLPNAVTYLLQPSGMAISQEGHLIVAERAKHCITIINTANGEVIDRFGHFGSGRTGFRCPEGVSLTQDGYIIVADSSNHRIQVLTVDGTLEVLLETSRPCDLAIHKGKVFITEQWNHRVQVLNSDLSYSHCFGSKGSKPGELHHPCGIAIDQDGMVYVSDFYNHRIQKFTPEGNVLAAFDNKEAKNLFSPYGLCIDGNNLLYVTDRNNNTVCVYNTSGQFLGYIGNSDGSSFDSPNFIVSDKDRLYISDVNRVMSYKCYQH